MKQKFISVLAVISLLFGNTAVFAQSSSSNYSLSEAFVGSGGSLDSASASFQAKASLGDLGVGNSASSLFQVFAGFTTTDQPYLEFYVDATDINFGVMSDSATSYGTTNFYVRAYLTSGYTVTTLGSGLQNENSTQLTNLTSNAAATTGVEQFGMNLVANTAPATLGANPVQVPDATFSFGEAAPNYDTSNSYRYNEGETIARSTESTGQTNYTASYIANISPVTEAGFYTMDQVYIATATY